MGEYSLIHEGKTADGTGASSTPPRHGWRRRFAWAPIPLFATVIAILYLLDIRAAAESRILLTILNIVFTAQIAILVAILAARTYLAEGSPALLLLGCGNLVLGITTALIGVFSLNPNALLTVHNSAVCWAGLFCLASALAALAAPKSAPPRRPVSGPTLFIAYAGIAVAVPAGAWLALCGLVPPFLVPGQGPTLLREVVLGVGVVLFGLAAVFFRLLYRRTGSRFAEWYSVGLILYTIGLVGVWLTVPGTPLNWTGRAAQYLAGLYLLAALLAAQHKSGAWQLSLELALQDTEKRLRTLVEATFEGIAITQAGRFVDVNDQFCKMTGYTRRELIGASVSQLAHPEDSQRVMDNIVAGRDSVTEHRVLRKDGSVIVVEAHGRTIRGTDGRMRRFTAIRDISERKRAEDSLPESEDRMQQALRVSRSFTFEWNPSTDQVMRSASCASILKLSGDEAVRDTGRRYFQRVHPDDRDRFVQMLDNLTPASSGYLTEYRVSRGDGSEAVLEEVGQATFDASGTLVRLVGVTTDITARKQAEAALARTTELLETLLASAPLGFCYIDRELRYVRINDRLAAMNGIPAADHIGRTVAEMVPELLPAAQEVTARILASGEAVVGHEVIGETPAQPGTARYWSESWYPVRDARGAISGFGVIVEDVSARKQAEAALRESMAELERFNERMVGRELRMIELKTQINELSAELGRPPPYQVEFRTKAEG